MSELKNPVRMSLREAFALIGRSLELGKPDNAMALLGDLEPQIMGLVEEVERLREREADAATIIAQGVVEYDLLKAEVVSLTRELEAVRASHFAAKDMALRAARERNAYLRMLTPESPGGLWYAATGRLDPFVVSWTAMELDGPWHDRADAIAAVRKKAGLDTVNDGTDEAEDEAS